MESSRCWIKVLCELLPIPNLCIISQWICPAISLVFLNLLILMSWDGDRCWGIQPVPVAWCAAAGELHMQLWVAGPWAERPWAADLLHGTGQGDLWPSQGPFLVGPACAVNKLLCAMRYIRLCQRRAGVKQVGNLVWEHVSEVCRETSQALVGSLKLPAAKVLWSQQLKSLALGVWLPESCEWSNWEVSLTAGSKIHSYGWKKNILPLPKWGTKKYFRWGVWLQDREKIPGWSSYDCYMQNY